MIRRRTTIAAVSSFLVALIHVSLISGVVSVNIAAGGPTPMREFIVYVVLVAPAIVLALVTPAGRTGRTFVRWLGVWFLSVFSTVMPLFLLIGHTYMFLRVGYFERRELDAERADVPRS